MLLRETKRDDRVRISFGAGFISAQIMRVSDVVALVYDIDTGGTFTLPGDTECWPMLAEGTSPDGRLDSGGFATQLGAAVRDAAPPVAPAVEMAPAAPVAPSVPDGGDFSANTNARAVRVAAIVAKVAEMTVLKVRSLGAPDAEQAVGEAMIRQGFRLMGGADG